MIHVCNITAGYGTRIRILAARSNVRGPLADFDLLILVKEPGKPVEAVGDGDFKDFPRALGVQGLFGAILENWATHKPGPALDEQNQPVELPERKPADFDALAKRLRAEAREANAYASQLRVERRERRKAVPR